MHAEVQKCYIAWCIWGTVVVQQGWKSEYSNWEPDSLDPGPYGKAPLMVAFDDRMSCAHLSGLDQRKLSVLSQLV